MSVHNRRFTSIPRWFRPPTTAVCLTALLLSYCLCRAAEASLAIIDAGVQQSDDAPFVSTEYHFLPGDFVYFTFQVAGFRIKSDDSTETKQISLEYEVIPEDAKGVPLTAAEKGSIKDTLQPEDKNWTPKRRAHFLLPSFVAAGEYKLHVTVKDLIANTEVARDLPFLIGGVKIQPSPTITVENYHFYRREDDRQPLEVPAFSPGDSVYARFDMVGYKLGPDNGYHLGYGISVSRPDGKPFINQANAAELQASSFYPAQFVPGNINLTTPRNALRGEYVLVLTVRDLNSNQTYESKQAFSIE
ncbi:MAG: hypothetical protein JO138_11195 [Acidobacteriaceae bacterium]|nr:hypothetical protein [Acidobacteriaceae bacterium]